MRQISFNAYIFSATNTELLSLKQYSRIHIRRNNHNSQLL